MDMLPFASRRLLVVAIAAGISTLSGNAALAQTGPKLEEVIVTAQKQEETIQSVPIAISALSTAAIEARGVENVGDLMGSMPNMGGFEAPGSRGAVSISIRGIAAGSPANMSVDPANAVYLDGVYMGKTAGLALDVAELERIEVLRGPQGTLYGRNSTGGAVNFITRKPTGELGGKVTATAGNYGLWGLKGCLDLPAIGTAGEGLGTLAANLGYQIRQRDYLYENTNPALHGFEDVDREAWRVALEWQPTDMVSVNYAYDRSDLDEQAQLQQLTGLTRMTATGNDDSQRLAALNGYLQAGAAGRAGLGPLAGAAAGDPTFSRWLESTRLTRDALSQQSKSRPSRGSSNHNSPTSSTNEGHSLTVDWDIDGLGAFGDVTLRSITASREMQNSNYSDLDGLDNSINANGVGVINDTALSTLFGLYQLPPAMGRNFMTGFLWDAIDEFGANYAETDATMDYEQFSQELQWIGSTDRLDYVVGLYYFSDEGKFRNNRAFAQPLGGVGSTSYDNETEAKAIFGQTTWRPPVLDDRLALTVGLRYTEETKDITYLYTDAGVPLGAAGPNLAYTGVPVPTATYGQKFSEDFNNTSGKINIAYDLAEGVNVFLTYSTAYRSGGFNGEVFNNPYDEETIEQWELGLKSDWLDSRLRVNAALFTYEYQDMQVSQISVDAQGRTTSSINNAGSSERYGGELEVQYAATDDLVLGFSYSFIRGDFEEYADFCAATGCIPNTEDLAKRGSPEQLASMNANYTIARLPFGDLKAYVEANWQDDSRPAALWTGTYGTGAASTAVPFDPIVLDERLLINARLTLDSIAVGDGTLRASLWGRNVFDQDYRTFGINYASLGLIGTQFGEPRTYGLDVTYEF